MTDYAARWVNSPPLPDPRVRGSNVSSPAPNAELGTYNA